MNGDGVLLPQFHLRPDEELVAGVELDPAGQTWTLRMELLLRISDRTLHRYGPIWLEPDTIQDEEPEALERFIRETLTASGYTAEPVEPDDGP